LAAELAGIIRAQKPDAIFACDPVMGDDDALYVKPDLADAIATDLVPIADVLLPNVFELARLTGKTIKDGAGALEAARALQLSSRVKVLVATGIPAGRPDRIAALALEGSTVHRAEAPRRRLRVAGTGDTFTALFTGHYVRDRDAAGALRFAMEAMDTICAATEAADADELLIVQAQDDWAGQESD
jgi:pyridoxine kinase